VRGIIDVMPSESSFPSEPAYSVDDSSSARHPQSRIVESCSCRGGSVPLDRRSTDPLAATDRALLSALERDGRTPNAELAAIAGVAASTAHLRTRLLRERGVLRGIHADVDPALVGRPLQAIVAVRLHGHTHAHVDAFHALAPHLPGVLQVFHLAGQDDYLLHVAVRDADALRSLILDRITSHPAVRATQTHLVFEHARGDGVLAEG
jgi:DNA-binding Lrp family transcriptional regulator